MFLIVQLYDQITAKNNTIALAYLERFWTVGVTNECKQSVLFIDKNKISQTFKEIVHLKTYKSACTFWGYVYIILKRKKLLFMHMNRSNLVILKHESLIYPTVFSTWISVDS